MTARRNGSGVSATAIGALLLASCVTNPSTNQEQATDAQSPYRYGISWGPMGRGGAAERASDYIHVLHQGKSTVIRNTPAAENSPHPESAAASAVDRYQRANISQLIESIVSALETPPRSDVPTTRADDDKVRNAWKRYCRGGEGLTENDWEILKEAGAPDNIPADLAANCIPPK